MNRFLITALKQIIVSKISQVGIDFITEQVADGYFDKPSSEIIESLKDFRLKNPSNIFRCLTFDTQKDLKHHFGKVPKKGQTITYTNYDVDSWSHSERKARTFCDDRKYYLLLKYKASPNETLVDTGELVKIPNARRIFRKEDVYMTMKAEKEVILQPGKYQVEVLDFGKVS